MNRATFNAHCEQLTACVRACAVSFLAAHGYSGIQPVPGLSYATLEELKRMHYGHRALACNRFPVLAEFCEGTIYGVEVNRLYRGWHDLKHIEMDVGFDFVSEVRVAQAKAQSIPFGPLRNIMLADAQGESEFAHATGGKFPRRQRDFAYDYVSKGAAWAIAHHMEDGI